MLVVMTSSHDQVDFHAIGSGEKGGGGIVGRLVFVDIIGFCGW